MKPSTIMDPIGGYFGLDLSMRHRLPHKGAIPVNFGRGGLEVIVIARKYTSIWIPDYICPSVPTFLKKLGITTKFYTVNRNFEPNCLPSCNNNEAFLYVNYFGIKDKYCRFLEQSQTNLILDLTQAFFYIPRNADGFNSARKFIGVPDGGFVYLTRNGESCEVNLQKSHSYECCAPLIKRADGDIAGGYKDFQALSSYWRKQHAAQMSDFSKHILMTCNLKIAAKRRRDNYAYLFRELAHDSLLRFPLDGVPLVYPYQPPTKGEALREYLIANKVFCPSYWPDIPNQTKASIGSSSIVFLPIDQRYGTTQMRKIVNLIHKF